MKTARIAVAIVAAAALVPLAAGSAFAAPPANDYPGGAVALTLGDTINEDTTEATTGTFDAKVNQFCGAPYTNASVWFTYTPSSDGDFIVDGTQSDYSTGFMLFRGAPTGRSLRACGPDEVAARGKAGTTYTIMAFSPTQQNGGNLVLSLEEAPPPPTVDVTVNPTGRAYPNGNALISGTYTCAGGDFIDIYGTLTQIWKRVKITGYFDKFYVSTCNGEAQPWQRIVSSDNGLYAAGAATVSVQADVCGLIDCSSARLDDVSITLRGPSRPAAQPRPAQVSVVPTGNPCTVKPGVSLYNTPSACQLHALVR